jgi:hypothetical protein
LSKGTPGFMATFPITTFSKKKKISEVIFNRTKLFKAKSERKNNFREKKALGIFI